MVYYKYGKKKQKTGYYNADVRKKGKSRSKAP